MTRLLVACGAATLLAASSLPAQSAADTGAIKATALDYDRGVV
jgi:hypothetical protein